MDENIITPIDPVPSERDYLITVKVPFKAIDDVIARERTQELSKAVLPTILLPGASLKLQRLAQGKPPEGVTI